MSGGICRIVKEDRSLNCSVTELNQSKMFLRMWWSREEVLNTAQSVIVSTFLSHVMLVIALPFFEDMLCLALPSCTRGS